MSAADIIARALAKPFTHTVTTHYADGICKRHDTRSLAAAENWAVEERRKIGRTLIGLADAETVTVVAVTIAEIAMAKSGDA